MTLLQLWRYINSVDNYEKSCSHYDCWWRYLQGKYISVLVLVAGYYHYREKMLVQLLCLLTLMQGAVMHTVCQPHRVKMLWYSWLCRLLFPVLWQKVNGTVTVVAVSHFCGRRWLVLWLWLLFLNSVTEGDWYCDCGCCLSLLWQREIGVLLMVGSLLYVRDSGVVVSYYDWKLRLN